MTVLFVEGFDKYETTNVVNFPRHHRYRCRESCEGCCICDGGLYSCTRCHGAEASLPTDCPGEPMSHGLQDDVAAGLRDYRWREGGWVLL